MRRVRVGVKRKDDDMIVKERIITSFFLGFIFNSTSLFSLQLFQCRVTVWCSFFISLSFFFISSMDPRQKGNTRTKEQTTNETPFPRLCKTGKYNPFSFSFFVDVGLWSVLFFFASLFCLCIFFLSSVVFPLVCSLSLLFFSSFLFSSIPTP